MHEIFENTRNAGNKRKTNWRKGVDAMVKHSIDPRYDAVEQLLSSYYGRFFDERHRRHDGYLDDGM